MPWIFLGGSRILPGVMKDEVVSLPIALPVAGRYPATQTFFDYPFQLRRPLRIPSGVSLLPRLLRKVDPMDEDEDEDEDEATVMLDVIAAHVRCLELVQATLALEADPSE